jgi:hypothetical protein
VTKQTILVAAALEGRRSQGCLIIEPGRLTLVCTGWFKAQAVAATHKDDGQGFAEGEVRPSHSEILRTIRNGTRTPGKGDSTRILPDGVLLYINHDLPLRSTAAYR